MDALHQAVINWARTKPSCRQCWIFVFGAWKTDAGGEETKSGSSEDKQLSSSVCSYHVQKVAMRDLHLMICMCTGNARPG